MPVSATTLTEWLVLVPVFALEVGAAFSVLLVEAVSGQRGQHPRQPLSTKPIADVATRDTVDSNLDSVDAEPVRLSPRSVDSAVVIPFAPVHAHDKDEVATRLAAFLRGQGGQVETSIRDLASKVGAGKSTLHNAVADLVMAGGLIVEAGKRGSVYRLIEVAA